jgi:hypothetical protein
VTGRTSVSHGHAAISQIRRQALAEDFFRSLHTIHSQSPLYRLKQMYYPRWPAAGSAEPKISMCVALCACLGGRTGEARPARSISFGTREPQREIR